MKLKVNGETMELPAGQTVRGLIETVGLKGKAVAVEVNQAVVRRKDHETATLREGDVVEIVTLVGGG
ncbi:MAG: sulfur carrier protein ThiS [Planctomycetota bacterium]|nr:sulfur carrier protein ThiS [Planctomycetota bacterium]